MLKKVFDVISRERALEPYKDLNDDDVISVWMIKKNINELPPVTPQQKLGKWIECIKHDEYDDYEEIWYECDQCHVGADYDFNFCPNCGAKMESEEV